MSWVCAVKLLLSALPKAGRVVSGDSIPLYLDKKIWNAQSDSTIT
jgi:hypothetical protein